MGIRGILKKLDPKRSDAPSLSNPYAQEQQPTDPPPGYQEHDPRDRDQYIQQPPQKSYGGLPSGPRSGVRPGGAASGYPARSASNGPPPQQYPSPGAQPYQYGGSDYSPNSTGSTPVFPSNTSSPALGSAYPKEKYGTQDGVGGSRWEAPGASSYGNPAPLSSQRQGGYGSLGASGGVSRANFNTPQQQAASTYSVQPGAPDAFSNEAVPMTDEEREESQVQSQKAEVIQVLNEGVDLSNRIDATMDEAIGKGWAMLGMTHEQGQQFYEIEKKAKRTGTEVRKGKDNLRTLDVAQGMMNFVGNSKKAIQSEEERKMMHDRNHDDEVEELSQQQRKAARDFADLQAKLEADQRATEQPNTRVLGGNTNDSSNFSKFMFEDDDGRQEEANHIIQNNLAKTEVKAGMLHTIVKAQNKMLGSQDPQVERITEIIDRSSGALHQNNVHLQTKYLKR